MFSIPGVEKCLQDQRNNQGNGEEKSSNDVDRSQHGTKFNFAVYIPRCHKPDSGTSFILFLAQMSTTGSHITGVQ